ncbi:nucleobase:cation symporter-2 family protein [Microbacterium thalassium]|uniref:NCS2 family nucleobase:cation symporter-2 n=1 Tax=Microbacterium thalassium TaxID=362649 RepID=A0A7X0FMD8_9MICO|nr:nucleobase:cation symporter-2 family protein [Microbacterium thalassium]MBB6390158.1 NCS2 family nucleobase:cation symporter-2 [Microbacterium thalassium]GLK25266.1 uracil permease [Microbacterium thalassium]
MTTTDDDKKAADAKAAKKAARRERANSNSVDSIPPFARLFPLGLQHVLALYAGAVAVPLIVGGALGYSSADLAFLISADLFIAGIATIVQSVGFWRFGVRLPLMQGVTFAAVGPMIAIGLEHGITTIFGSVIACGLFMILIAPFFSQLLRFFPPIVTGTVILIIGLSLMRVAAGWIMTGSSEEEPGAPPINVAFAFGTLLFIVLIERFAPAALARVSVLLGLVFGTIAALFVPGMVDWSGVGEAGWFAVVTPFHFGLPTFEIVSILSMLIVGIVIMTETTGDMIAVGEIVEKPVKRRQLADGLRADGLGTVLGGIFNTFPYTAFAQNVGLVSLTGVKSRYVATMAGAILIVLGLIPKVSALVEGVPRAVLGGAGIALFGMVAASGIRTLTKVKFDNRNVLIVALSVGIALLPTVTPTIYEQFPTWFQLIFDSGISAGAIVAILLNLLLNSHQLRDDPAISAHDAVRGPAAAALVHPDATGTGLIPTHAFDEDGKLVQVVPTAEAGEPEPPAKDS